MTFNSGSGSDLYRAQCNGDGFLTWSYPRTLPGFSLQPGNQSIQAMAMPFSSGMVVTNCHCMLHIIAAGTPPSLIKMGIFDKTSKMIAQSANLAASAIWTTAPLTVTIALTSPVTIPSSDLYYVAFLINGVFGTTQLQLGRVGALNAALWNAIGSGISPALGSNGQTDFPANGNNVPGLGIAPALGFWFAAS